MDDGQELNRQRRGAHGDLGQMPIPIPLLEETRQAADVPAKRLLGALARGRNNNLHLLRLLAASLVLLSHSWPATQGTIVNEPGMRWFGLEMGRMAVWVFFSISGFLVAASWDRRPSLGAFAMARARRIYPGLIVMLVLLVFGLGPIVTTLPLKEYFGQRQTWGFLLFNIGLYDLRWTIPSVFDGAPLNGSLWTLPVEARCYITLGLLGWMGMTRRTGAYVVVFFALGLAALTGALGEAAAPAGFSFFAGVCAWRWRDKVVLNGFVAAAGVSLALVLMHLRAPFAAAVFVPALAYASLYLAYVPAGAIRKFNRLGDYSYGVYIYAFPVQVTVHRVWPDLTVLGMFAIALSITLVLAALSWKFVESPVLRFGVSRDERAPNALGSRAMP